jgi:mono/diheme cytochrome c family protein
MSRLAKILALAAACAVPFVTAACGTEKISVPKSNAAVYHGAVLFSERCAGCHTLNAAATHGSAANIRDATFISGPNFNVRCERPITRVLYAIENGGFSGAYMPQNVVVGQDAIDVAKFVATYAGRDIPPQVGVAPCQDKPIGTLPPGSGTDEAGSAQTAAASGATAVAAAPATTPATSSARRGRAAARPRRASKKS